MTTTLTRHVGMHCVTVLAALTITLWQLPAAAQLPSNGLRSGNSGSSSLRGSSIDLEYQLRQLQQSTGRTRQQLEAPLREFEPNDSGVTASIGDVPGFESEADSIGHSNRPGSKVPSGRGVGDIRQRIELLRRLKLRAGRPNQSSGNMNSTSGNSLPVPNPPPTLSKIEENLNDKPKAAQQPIQQNADSISATKVLSDPVSHLKLGQSLYHTSNYAAALKALQRVDVAQLNQSDKSWIELLIALCERRLGQVDAAQARLRDLSNSKSADQPVLAARWWLGHTEIVRDAKSIMQDSAPHIDSLIERSQKHAPR